MDKQNAFPIEEYIDIAIRRKWLIIIPFILSLIITAAIFWRLPKIYRSDTLIMILPQKVPLKYVRSTVDIPIEARLSTIAEEILSHTRLVTIINELNPYPEARRTEHIDQIVSRMRGDITIEVKKDKSSFQIYYQGKDSETVRRVTNKLASSFIEESLKTREQQARITAEFLNKELISVKEKLEEQERAITEFKYKHIGNLPEQNTANLEMLRQLADQRQTISERIARAEDKALLIRQQLSGIEKFQSEEDSTSLQAQLEAAQKELMALKGTYTDKHIEVRKVQEQIKQLEDHLASKGEGLQDETLEESQTIDPMIMDLKNQLMLSNKEIERLKKDEARIQQQITIYEERLEEVPRVELELAALTRGYTNTKRFYDELLSKKMEAEQAENLERRQQGEQFRILVPASLPIIPYKPDAKKVFAMGVFLGLCAGCGLTFLAEMLDKSFRNVKEVEEYLGVPVLASIPQVKKEELSDLIVHS